MSANQDEIGAAGTRFRKPMSTNARNLTRSGIGRPTKAMQRDADAVSIDYGFGRACAVVERPEVSQGAPLMAKTFCGLRENNEELENE